MKDDSPNTKKVTGKSPDKIVVRISNISKAPLQSISSKNLDMAIRAGGGKLPDPNYATALHLWTKGVSGKEWVQEIEMSRDFFSEKEFSNLNRIGNLISTLEKVYPDTTKDFSQANLKDKPVEIVDPNQKGPSDAVNKTTLSKSKNTYVPDTKSDSDYYSPDFQEKSADYLQSFVDKAQDKVEYVTESYQEEPISPPSSYPQSSPKFDQPATRETYSPPTQYPSIRSPLPSPTEYLSQVGRGLQRSTNQISSNAKRAVSRNAKKWLGKVAGTPIMTALAAAAPHLALAGAIIAAFWTYLISMIILIIVWTLGFIVFVAIMLFIINSGAYMVPPGDNLGQGGTYSGNLPEECPAIWPVTGPLPINQGPNYCGTNGSHCNLQAIDVGGGAGLVVLATHTGVVDAYFDACTGNTVTVTSTCNGTQVSSIYAHLGSITIQPGTLISRGTPIGITDNTGRCTTGAHLHYAFLTGTLPMAAPYIPDNIEPLSCCGVCLGGVACTTTIP